MCVCVCVCVCVSLLDHIVRCSSLAEELRSEREEAARREGERREREREVERLQSQLQEATRVSPCNQGQLGL